jgi:ribulose-phosphate 3-epimerase
MEATCGCFSYSKLTPDVNNLDDAADPLPLIDAIHERKMKAGVAISPDTPSSVITDEIAAAADMLLVMTVYPGM